MLVHLQSSSGALLSAGGGVTAKHIPNSRMIGSLFFCLELVTLLVAAGTMMPAMPEYRGVNAASAALIAAALALHAW